MRYFSTTDHDQTDPVDFRTAVLQGLARDGGLYVPESIQRRTPSEWFAHRSMSTAEIAADLLAPYVAPSLSKGELSAICKATFHFDFPLVEVDPHVWSLELFHGPTLAFKDVGARFLAECLTRFSDGEDTIVLVATSGDTGSAVANGFAEVKKGVRTVILYPKGKVSPLQEKQLASLGGNVAALRVEGTFDDCQRLVKRAFSDSALNEDLQLSSANSINIARWLPQSIYYAHAAARLDADADIVFSVPSGNFGNITAGIFASRSGLAVRRWVAALNANDVVRRYLRSGAYEPRPTVATVANAMDVGDPSNLSRLQYLFAGSFEALVNEVDARSFGDAEITDAIVRVHRETGYLMDPHGATGWLALEKVRGAVTWNEETQAIFLETAHPAKFGESIERHTGLVAPVPERLAAFENREVRAEDIGPQYEGFRSWLRTFAA